MNTPTQARIQSRSLGELRVQSEAKKFGAGILATLLLLAVGTPGASAQISTVLLQDDFASNAIDPNKYKPDAPFFEGGKGDIHAEARNGVIEFVGTTSQQWWSGGTLQIAGTFEATEQTPVTVTIDRVSEAGVGTASRSALWILDETKTSYVLFADVRGEGGWRYNRKIGETGDVPTGSGTNIPLFDGATFDDGGLHKMKMVADGKTVKLYLDGTLGPEVKFPFSKVIFEFGSYARANNDTAATTWDNLRIETNLKTSVVFSDDFASDTINAGKFQPDAPFFEGGKGDIHAEARNGVIEFVGTTTQQWWSGGTLRVVPTFDATEQTPVAVTIDRISEKGVGTASRSALWILYESQTSYVLFAVVRGVGGWRYNRKIGEAGDVPTGSGTNIPLLDGASFDDGGLHKMRMVADGKTVKLYLDDLQGPEIKFPFSKVIFEFGSYARANNDTASTTWDNIKIETVVRQTSVVFSDDFAANAIDPAKYQPDAPFFEGGKGDIHTEARNGTIEFLGTTTQQWWSGGTLRIVPTFAPSESETITLSIDRVSEKGVGTASRSALWILNETQTSYVLFADVRGEGGWRYNRKIGEAGDVPTGSGTDIAAFNGATFDDGGLHRMSMVADGKTEKLLLDGTQGAEIKFPFSPVIFEFGSYARANNDTASTVWDNLKIESAGGATFAPAAVSVRNGQVSPAVTVRIPQGLNSQKAVQIRVVSSDANIAVPEGGTGASLALTFPAGGANTTTLRVRGVNLGGAQFSIEGDIPGGNKLSVAVISNPGVVLQEDFAAATIDSTKWQVSKRSFEVGTGTYDAVQKGGVLDVSGVGIDNFWSGASFKTAKSYVATKELNLVFEVDRVSIEQVGSAGRTGVYITTDDRSRYVFFAQNVGENNWQVNVNPGNPTGGGTALTAFAGVTDTAKHRMKLIANGQTVEVFLDGVSGGSFPFEVTSGIFFEIGAYARATDDSVRGVFDNVRIESALPCVSANPQTVSMTAADAGRQVTVTIPQLLNDAAPVAVTVTSRDPKVAVPGGAAGGTLTLNFAAGAANTQTFTVAPTGLGATTFEIASNPQNCVLGAVKIEVVAVPQVLLTDDFAASAIDQSKWKLDNTPFDTGVATPESAITLEKGQAKIAVTVESSLWPGLALLTANTFSAGPTTPVTFEIDRALIDFDLVTGTGAEQRTGIWIKDALGNFVLFADYLAHDARNFGWRYNKMTGQADDNPTDAGINIAAFDGPKFDDRKNHRMKLVANGATVKLYLDDVLGAEVPFPFSQQLTFGFGAYADETGNVVRGYFDNAKISGGSAPTPPRLTAALQGGKVVISWTGTGTLQEAAALASPVNWSNVTPAPAGNSYTVPTGAPSSFYRIRQ
ncbi:MAG: hypothetical protein HY735_35535 [Verrucomicrobia bacterium]|nr:hypothetical protein [Verrucomicrobiota bacterium]